MAPERVLQRFEQGVAWALANAGGFSPDARLAALAGLLLADPDKAQAAGGALRNRREVRLSPIGKLLDLLAMGAVSRRLRQRANAFFDLIARDPSPLVWTDLDSFRHVPDSLPASLDDLHRIDGAHANAALEQASAGGLKGPVLSWLRREDLWGYDLAHQLLAWVVCLKAGQRTGEARERAGRLAWRLFHEVQHCSLPVHYDLFAEQVAFLSLAGFPQERLTEQLLHIVASQDSRDGGWWFTQDPADQASMIEQAASPMMGRAGSHRDQPDPAAALRRLEILHRGHSTGLSLWALGLWLRGAPASPQGPSDAIPASGPFPDRDSQP